MRRNRVPPVRVHGHKGSKRLSPEQKAEVQGIVTQILGEPVRGSAGLEVVVYLLAGNIPPLLRGGDELHHGVRAALLFAERYQRGEFDAASVDLWGRDNPFHKVVEELRTWLDHGDPEKTKPDGETSGSGGSV